MAALMRLSIGSMTGTRRRRRVQLTGPGAVPGVGRRGRGVGCDGAGGGSGGFRRTAGGPGPTTLLPRGRDRDRARRQIRGGRPWTTATTDRHYRGLLDECLITPGLGHLGHLLEAALHPAGQEHRLGLGRSCHEIGRHDPVLGVAVLGVDGGGNQRVFSIDQAVDRIKGVTDAIPGQVRPRSSSRMCSSAGMTVLCSRPAKADMGRFDPSSD